MRERRSKRRQIGPEDLSPKTLSYIAEWATLNQPPLSAGQIVGAERYDRQIDVTSDLLTVASSVAETEIYNYTLGGGTLGTRGGVHLYIDGRYKNSSGSGSTFEIKVLYGSDTMYEDVTASFASLSPITPFLIDLHLTGGASTSQQFLHGKIIHGPRSAAPASGVGIISAAGSVFPIAGAATQDSTLNKAIVVKVQHSNNSADTTYVRRYAVLTKFGH